MSAAGDSWSIDIWHPAMNDSEKDDDVNNVSWTTAAVASMDDVGILAVMVDRSIIALSSATESVMD